MIRNVYNVPVVILPCRCILPKIAASTSPKGNLVPQSILLRKMQEKSFEVQTRWIVLTGAPCSGKTTLHSGLKIVLENQGILFIDEVARAIINEGLAIGKDLSEIRGNEWVFQGQILARKIQIEANLSSKQVVIFDRGIPDGLSHHRLSGLDPDRVLSACFHHKYALVFLLEPLPLEADGIRFDDIISQRLLHDWIQYDYESLGYEVFLVPVMATRRQRVDFVLHALREYGVIQSDVAGKARN